MFAESAKLHATRALVPYVHSCLTCLVPYVPLCPVTYLLLCPTCLALYRLSCLTCLVSYVPFCLACFVPYVLSCLTCLRYFYTSSVLWFAFSRDACVSCHTSSFARHPSLTSGVSRLTYSYSSDVSQLYLSYLSFLQPGLRLIIVICHFLKKERHYNGFSYERYKSPESINLAT